MEIATPTPMAALRWGAYAAIALAAGIAVAVLPAVGTQLAVVVGVGGLTVAVAMARAGRVLNPAWILVIGLYLMGPVGSLLAGAGIAVSMVGASILLPVPFVLAALVTDPRARDRLVLLVPLALLVLLATASLVWSPAADVGLDKLTVALLNGFVPAAFLLVLASASRDTSWALVATAALVSSLALVAFGDDSALYPGRATLFGANPIWAARSAFLGALVVLFGPFPSWARLAAVPMIIAGLGTASLGPAVGFVVGAWAGIAETLRISGTGGRRVAASWAVFGLVLGGLVLIILTGALGPLPRSVAELIDDPNVLSRATYLEAAAALIVEAPVFGVGLGGFAATGLDVYPHNLLVEVAAEAGLLGLACLMAWYVIALRGAAGSPVLVSLVIGTAVFSLFSGSLASNAEFWLITGLAAAYYPLQKRRAVPSLEAPTYA